MSGITPASDAAEKTFNVAELLEAILLELPMLDLLLAQRVCKLWRATIQGSIHIQRALFFEPAEGMTHLGDGGVPPKLNPLLAKVYAEDCYYVDMLKRKHVFDKDAHPGWHPELLPLVYHTAACAAQTQMRGNEYLSSTSKKELHVHLATMSSSKRRYSKSQLYKEASWRKMYATQPPLSVHVTTTGGITHYGGIAADRMGTIVKDLSFHPDDSAGDIQQKLEYLASAKPSRNT